MHRKEKLKTEDQRLNAANIDEEAKKAEQNSMSASWLESQDKIGDDSIEALNKREQYQDQ